MLAVVVRRLVWHCENVAHIARHSVVLEEVEQVCHGKHISFVAKEGRLLLIGQTKAGRVLAVIMDPEPEEAVYYPVTARTASRKERGYWLEQKAREGDNKKKT